MGKVRHSSLQSDVVGMRRRFEVRILNIKRVIHVQKIKVKKREFNSRCFLYERNKT